MPCCTPSLGWPPRSSTPTLSPTAAPIRTRSSLRTGRSPPQHGPGRPAGTDSAGAFRMTAVDQRKRTSRLRLPVRAAALAGLLVLAACGSGGAGPAGPAQNGQAQAALNPDLDPGTSLHGIAAPGFRLVNQFGQPMSLSQFRGKVVILAFTDSECTTICPLTTVSMVEAKDLLGAAGDQVQLLGIDANPSATRVADVMGLLPGPRHGQPVGLPDRLARAAARSVEGLLRLRADRERADRPHPGGVRDRPAGPGAEAVPDHDGVCQRRAGGAGPG